MWDIKVFNLENVHRIMEEAFKELRELRDGEYGLCIDESQILLPLKDV